MKQWMNAFVRGGGSRILRGRIRPRFAPIGWILRASSAAKKIGAPRMERRVVSRLATKRIDLHLLPPRIQVNQGRFVPIRRSTSGRMLCGSCSSVVPEASAPITAVARRDDVIN